jgi:PAS domain S-box-containing protein
MPEFLQKLFDTDFMPHVFCLRSPGLIWLHAVADALIALAYFIIPLGLLRLVQKRKDLSFHWMFVLFAVFILSCGATHVLGIVTLWHPIYRFEAVVKVVTALASVATAIILVRLLPQFYELPSLEQWRRSNAELEERVNERTAQLLELTAAWDLAHGFIRDTRGVISFWCDGSEKLYGWKKDEALGRTSHELLHTQFPIPLAEIEEELSEKGSWEGELVHMTKSGERKCVASHWVRLSSQGKGTATVIEVNADITDRLRADETSRLLAAIVESSNDAIIGTDLDCIVTNWNKSAEALFGYSAAEMIGKSIEVLIPDHYLEEQRLFADAVGQGGEAKRFETVRLAKHGRLIPVSITISPIRNSAGRLIGTSRTLHDISLAKAQEEALRQVEERQRLAVESGQVGLWYLDAASNRCIWTARCKELHGLGPDDETPDGSSLLLLVHADDREAVLQAMRQTLAGKTDLSVDYRTRGLDGRTNWVQARGRAQLDAHDNIEGIHGTVIDLTDRIEMEAKLRRANTELEQFAYAAAHDLQEPLRNVALAASLLRVRRNGSGHSPEESDEPRLLSTVIDNAMRMEAMVKDLLAYSRALDGDEEPSTRIDGNAVLERVLENLATVIREKQAEIIAEPLPHVAMEETHLVQVLQNLISNALKYSGPRPPRIEIGVRYSAGDMVLFVKDQGIGIAPHLHSRAFGMFKRLHNDGSAKGTGIGLTMCKRIVEHYGGKIWIESEEDAGATFLFTIPFTESRLS